MTKCDGRFVVFAGPGKTGSTSIQRFFGSNAYGSSKSAAFVNWTTPGNLTKDLTWCGNLLRSDESRRRVSKKARKMAQAVRDEMEDLRGDSPRNLFWTCEFVANATELGKSKISQLMKRSGRPCPEYVINYRTPRVDHFLSAWKQLTRRDKNNPRRDIVGTSPVEFVCSEKDPSALVAAVRTFSNSLGGAINLLEPANSIDASGPVTIIDMSGVAKAGRDVTHSIACDILGVECTDDGWVVGLSEKVRRYNARPRTGNELSTEQRGMVETLYRRRDCAYRDILTTDPRARVLYRDTLWKDCPKIIPASYSLLKDDGIFIEQLQTALGCSSSRPTRRVLLPKLQTTGVRELLESNQEISTISNNAKQLIKISVFPDYFESEPSLSSDPVFIVSVPLHFLLYGAFLVLSWTLLLRRIRCRKVRQERTKRSLIRTNH